MPIVMHKKVGETPLQALDRLRLENPNYASSEAGQKIPMTYAGRLDPMAEGVLLVLVGDECKNREEFLVLEKEYVCEIVWGFSTDTYDILGKIKNPKPRLIDRSILKEKLPQTLNTFIGKHMQQFPPYSSKPVKGKPLHVWAREDRLGEIEIPSKEIEIKSLELLEIRSADPKKLLEEILCRISLVKGDFRQDEIVELWKTCLENFKENPGEEVVISKIKVICSSGTYIRSIVDEWGKVMNTGATALSLLRTRVGDYR